MQRGSRLVYQPGSAGHQSKDDEPRTRIRGGALDFNCSRTHRPAAPTISPKYPLSTQQSLSEDDQAHIDRFRLSLAEQLIEEGKTLEPRHNVLFDELREKARAYLDKVHHTVRQLTASCLSTISL